MKTTKVFFIFAGALLIAGLFLFFRSKTSEHDISSLKPSQLDFTRSNNLNSSINTAKTTSQTAEGPQELDPKGESATVSSIENLTPSEKNQWSVFESILKTKNDNDPRLDQDFKKLSSAFREALYQKYALLPAEDHSGRGLIVYLIAKDISSMEDMQFLKKVYQEAPCLSLPDCQSPPNNSDPHHSGVDQTTLIYKQLSILHLIDKQLSANPDLLNDASSRSGFTQILAQAESYPIPAVHEKARALRAKYGL